MNKKELTYDAYPLEEDSDQECAESSDEDLDIILHGTLEQRKRLCKKRAGGEFSSEDEFEKEMKAELNSTMKKLRAGCTGTKTAINKSNAGTTGVKSQPQYYDNDYFDSDSDDDQTSGEKKTMKHPVQSNDELLYDPNMDEDDQKWVDNLRGRYQPAAEKRSLPTSDAILNCPCCMVTLCLDCQRHAFYQHQYRAMFVMNCTVQTGQVLRFPAASEPKGKKKKVKRRKSHGIENSCEVAASFLEAMAAPSSEEAFHPVTCSECNTEVGVYDHEEIYHFFNVLASHA